MSKVLNNLCCGCLSAERRMHTVEEANKQYIFQILGEISIANVGTEQFKLCWECVAYIKNWIKFKEQVKNAYKAMQDFTQPCDKKIQTRLASKKLYQLSFIPYQDEDDVLSIKKESDISYKESDNCNYVNVITEYCNHMFNDSILTNNTISVDILPKVDGLQTNDDLVLNNKEMCGDDDRHGSDDILMLNDDVVMSNFHNHVASVKMYKETIKLEESNILADGSDDELLVNFTTGFSKGKSCVKEKEAYLNGRASSKKRKSNREKKRTEFYKEVKLSKEALKQERKMAETNEEYINAMFRCEKCIISFPNSDDLTDHVTNKHEMNASKYKCSICDCSFSSLVSYNYHKKRHRLRYECVVCNERFITIRAVGKHCEVAHCLDPNVEFQKTEVNEKTKKTEDISNGDTELDRFPCDLCEKTFKWKTSLRKHAETHRIQNGLKRKPYCEPCRLSFSTTSNLQKHVKSSSNHRIQLKLIKLKDVEEQPNGDKQARIEQIKSSVMKSTQRFRCPHCDRMFQWRGNLQRHLANHAARASGQLICKPCDRSFSSIETYNQHMRISKKHVSENVFKFVCSDCGKRFADKIKLKDHIDWDHLKNYVHVCIDCDKVFKSRTSLLLHSRAVHKKSGMDHLCDHCGKAFANLGKLRSHIVALHMNLTPFKCALCPARFNWQACLSRHVKKVHHKARKPELPT